MVFPVFFDFLTKEKIMPEQLQQSPTPQSLQSSAVSSFPTIGEQNVTTNPTAPMTGSSLVDQIRAENPTLVAEAEAFANQLISVERADFRGKRDRAIAVRSMGQKVEEQFAVRSQMLNQPIMSLKESIEGGEVATSLLQLRDKVEELDPYQYKFGPGWFGRVILRQTPIIGKRVRAYLDRFSSAQSVLDQILGTLKNGQERIERDNDQMSDDQIKYRETQEELKKLIAQGLLLDASLAAKAASAQSDAEKFNQKFS
jgi:uncharacterized protein YaaN involved in tellurite resistance